MVTFKDFWLASDTFKKVQPDAPFDVPKRVLDKPQFIFGYHIVVLYDDEAEALEELRRGFGNVTSQSIWTWRREGLPAGRRKHLANMLTSSDYQLRLADNVTIDDLIKPYHLPVKRRLKAEPRINHDWLDLLMRMEAGSGGFEGYSRESLSRLAALSSRNSSNLPTWHIYRWGWENGGVPPTIAEKVWNALITMRIHSAMGIRKSEFRDYCNAHFRASTREPKRT